jgi:hypothetical protein
LPFSDFDSPVSTFLENLSGIFRVGLSLELLWTLIMQTLLLFFFALIAAACIAWLPHCMIVILGAEFREATRRTPQS